MSPAVISLIILAVVIVLLVKELIPMSTIGLLIPVALILTGIMDTKTAFVRLSDPTLILVSGVFVLSAAIFEVGVSDLIGNSVKSLTSRFKHSDKMIILLIMAITIAACSALPHIAVAAAMIPIVTSIAVSTGISRTKLLMVMSLTTSFGGSNTLIGTPPNLLAKAAIEGAGAGTFAFFDFAWAALPTTILGVAIILLFGDKLIPSTYVEEPVAERKIEISKLNPQLKNKQLITISLFVGFILSIIFEKRIGIPSYIVGVICVCILVFAKILDEKKAFAAINWPTTFFIFGILTMADALTKTKASQLIADPITQFLGKNPNPYLIVGTMFIVAATITQFISNTGAAGILLPIGLIIAKSIGADPRAVLMAVVIGCNSSFLTPMATPANTMIVVPAKLKFTDWLKAGVPLLIVSLVCCTLILPIVWPFY